MNDFYKARRERFLNEEPYAAFLKAFEFGIDECVELLKSQGETLERDDPRHIDWRWGIGSYRLQLLIGRYSAGGSFDILADQFGPMLAAIEATALPHDYITEPFYLDEPDTYAYAMWLLSLAKLLRQDHWVPRVAALFDVAREDNRGQDALFEALLEKLGLPREPADKCLKNMKAHPLLLEAIQAEPAKRPKLIAQFLDKWYPSMKGCYWHGRHTRVPQNFFGYWAFEAGLVTYLWGIDDSSYRDMPFYPKDLVAYARSHEAADPSAASGAGKKQRHNVHAGEPCPEAGFWFTPAQAGSRRFFKAGDVMPEFKSDYGTTIWQWDQDQDPPKL